MRIFYATLFCALLAPQLALSADRIVSVGGALTEIVFALDAQGKLAGVDTTSVYPEAAAKLPQVGYQRSLAAEGILAMNPDLVLLTTDAGPPAAIQQIKSTNITVLEVPEKHSLENVRGKIEKVASAVGKEEAGKELLKRFDTEARALKSYTDTQAKKPSTLFLMAMGPSLMAAGKETAANAMIEISGGKNMVTEYSKYRPINPEAILAGAPEVIVVTQRTAEALGGAEEILKRPELSGTPAAREKRLIIMEDSYLLGFGPRAGLAALELAKKLHGE